MASPQRENGFTAIANEILEALIQTSLTGGEYKVAFFVLRKTYGFQKKEDRISLTQFEKGCNLSRRTVVNCLNRLVKAKILVKLSTLPIAKYKFQKNYEEWLVKGSTLVKPTALVKNSTVGRVIERKEVVKGGIHTKETITKENTKEKEQFNKNLKKLKKKLGGV